MATDRVWNPKGDVVDTKEIESAGDAHAWFVDQKADQLQAETGQEPEPSRRSQNVSLAPSW